MLTIDGFYTLCLDALGGPHFSMDDNLFGADGLDSLDFLALVTSIEDRLGCQIDLTRAQHISSLRDIYNCVRHDGPTDTCHQ